MSSTLSFERVKRIPNKWKGLLSGYLREAVFPSNDIPESIKIVVLLFFYRIIESSILTQKETDILLSLFDEKNKFNDLGIFSYKLIYKRSVDGKKYDKVEYKVKDKKNILCIIHDDEDNVFGGYTSIGWGNKDEQYQTDNKAFLFLIRSQNDYPPGIYDAIKDKKTIRVQRNYYCIFGEEGEMFIYGAGHDQACNGGFSPGDSYEMPSYLIDTSMTGKKFDGIVAFKPKEVEMFQLISS